jgi:hypothetical protein
MRVFENCGSDPDASTIASEAFARSWRFIERDPILAGHDRDSLKAHLAQEIRRAMAEVPELDLLRIANRAIGRIRQDTQARTRAYP